MKTAKRGPSNYKQRKSGGADRYGSYRDGRLISSEYIAGHVISDQLNGYANNSIEYKRALRGTENNSARDMS